jgi:two-component system, OmpR family, alkaline phosphatase synthesis response regulator PhoP
MAKKKILVIDDMPNVVTMVKARLEASGYEVITALDGQQGLAYAYAEKPDLIILDIVMPAGGGYSVYTRLKMSPETRSIPVIFLTAKDRPEDVARAYKLGAQYFVKKPYKPEMLLGTVKKVLELSEHPQQPEGLQKRILVMGKEPELAEFVKLVEMGYEVTIVSSIKEGSDEAKKEKPDVIFLDGTLVKANNYDGFYQLKLEFASSKTPIIISVTKGELEEFQKKIEGFSSYCLKPFNYIDLLGYVRVALQKN